MELGFELISKNHGLFMIERGSDEGLEKVGPKNRDLYFRQNALFGKTHQIEDLVDSSLIHPFNSTQKVVIPLFKNNLPDLDILKSSNGTLFLVRFGSTVLESHNLFDLDKEK